MGKPVTRIISPWMLAAAIGATGMLGGCSSGEVGDPWVSGDQYAEERARDAETWNRLRERARLAQTDR